MITNANKTDVSGIVDVHCNAFKDFFLTTLGRDFLSFYYKCLVKNPDAICQIYKENNVIIGFAAASKYVKGFNTKLIKQNFFSFTLLSVWLLFSRPKSLLRLVKNLTKRNNNVDDSEDYAELYSIGVDKSAQGKGIGAQLLESIEKELKTQGVSNLSLTTDAINNTPTISFYKSHGYNLLYEFDTYPNRKMLRLIKSL